MIIHKTLQMLSIYPLGETLLFCAFQTLTRKIRKINSKLVGTHRYPHWSNNLQFLMFIKKEIKF